MDGVEDTVSDMIDAAQRLHREPKTIQVKTCPWNSQRLSRLRKKILVNKYIEIKERISHKALLKYVLRNKDKAQPATFGLGTESHYDPTVWSAKSLSLRQNAPTFFRTMVEKLRPTLEEFFYCKIHIEPSKISYYEKGDFCSKHFDTVISEDHVGTLVIGTKEDCIRGNFMIGKTRLNLNQNTHVAFTTDCYHSVEEVIGGCRIVVQYDIFRITENTPDDTKQPSAKLQKGDDEKVDDQEPLVEEIEKVESLVDKVDDQDLDEDQDASSVDTESTDGSMSSVTDGPMTDEECDDEEYDDDHYKMFQDIMPPLGQDSDYKDNLELRPHPKMKRALSDYCKIIGKKKGPFGLLGEHLYPAGFCHVLKGVDKLVVDRLLTDNPKLRCFCIPILVTVFLNDGDVVHELSVGSEYKKLVEGVQIIIHNKFAYDFVTSYCFTLQSTGYKAAEGDGEFLYSGTVVLFHEGALDLDPLCLKREYRP